MTPRVISELYYETQLDGQQSGKLLFFVCFLFVCLFFFTVIMELDWFLSNYPLQTDQFAGQLLLLSARDNLKETLPNKSAAM